MKENPPEVVTAESRKLAAIMFTDIVGFSRQMGENEARTLRLLEIHNHLIRQTVTEHHGKVIKTNGDDFLVDFPSVVHAVQCAQQIQAQFRAHNADKEKPEQIHIRIGIHLGDIVQRDGDVFGDGVNIASRLQTLAEPDTICISHKVYEEVEKKLPLGTMVSLGRPKLKNIAQRFRVYTLLPAPPQGWWQTLQVQRLKLSRRVGTPMLVFVSVVLLGGIVIFLYPSLPTFIIQHSAFIVQEAQPPLLPLPDKPSIVVLPFVNMSGDPGQEYFSDGLTEDLTTALTKVSGLFVIARNSAFTYKGRAVDVKAVSRELGIRYVLEGSVRKADSRVRINAQLVDGLSATHVWAESYDRELKDIFAVQDEVRGKIVLALKVKLTKEEQERFRSTPTGNLEAYEYLLRGVEYYFRRTKEANAQARQMFENAIALDPQYAAAHALLGLAHLMEFLFGWSPNPQHVERAFELAQRAIVLDNSLPLAHLVLGLVYVRQQQYEQAIAEEEKAIALDPNSASGYASLAEVLNAAGRPEEAIVAVEKAMRLDPHYPDHYLSNLALAYRLTGRYEEAIAAQKQLTLRNPNFLFAYTELAFSYLLQWGSQLSQDPQNVQRALEAAQRAVALNDSFWMPHLVLGAVYLWQQQYDQALVEVERAVALGPNVATGYAFLAETLSRVGRSEEALQMVEQALHRKAVVVDVHLANVGTAYSLSGRPEEAIAPLKQYLNHYPNILGAHLTLAAVYSELDREAEARTEVAEVLRLNPKFSLEVHRQRAPIKDPSVLERHIVALRKAGLK
jgi:adenylate cyclase